MSARSSTYDALEVLILDDLEDALVAALQSTGDLTHGPDRVNDSYKMQVGIR
jgi:hypothetical protein